MHLDWMGLLGGSLSGTLPNPGLSAAAFIQEQAFAPKAGIGYLLSLPIKNTIKDPVYIFTHFADAGNSTTTETDLYSDTTLGGQLVTNGDKLEAEYGGIFVSSGTATRQLKMYFGGTLIFDTGTLTVSLAAAWTAYVTITRVSATVIRYMISLTTEGAALAAYTAVGEVTGLTLTNTNILKITGQAAGVGAATNDIVAKLGSVLYRPF